MSCSCKGFGGFGLDVPTPGGVLTGDPCSSGAPTLVRLQMMEQMLADLGFYKGPVGPSPTPDVAQRLGAALVAYQNSKGLPVGAAFDDVQCAVIVSDWQALQAKKSTQRALLMGGAVVLASLGGYLVWRKTR